MRVYIKTDDLTHDSNGKSLLSYKSRRSTAAGESMMIGHTQFDGSIMVEWGKTQYVFRNLDSRHILAYSGRV